MCYRKGSTRGSCRASFRAFHRGCFPIDAECNLRSDYPQFIPSRLEDIAKDAARQRAIAFMVKVEAPDPTVRVNITARESQLAKIDQLAEAAGMTRSGYMVRAAIAGQRSASRARTRRTGTRSRR